MAEFADNFLSIQAGLYGLSFLSAVKGVQLFHQTRNTFKNPKNLEENLENELRAFILDKNEIHSIRIFHDNELNTFVPSRFFDPQHPGLYLQYNIKLLETDAIAHDHLPFLNAVNVYLPFVNINNKLLDFFPSVEYFHMASGFADYAFRNLNHNNKYNLFVQFSGALFRILIFDEIKLIFSNSFFNRGGYDFLYYLFFVWEQWQLIGRQTTVFLGGEHEAFEQAYQDLKDFTEQIELLPEMNHEILKSFR